MNTLNVNPGELWNHGGNFYVYVIEKGRNRNSWICLVLQSPVFTFVGQLYEYQFDTWDGKNSLWKKLF